MIRSRIVLLLTLLLLPLSNMMAQQLEGQLLDSEDKQPVAYANIGLPGTELGTNSDDQGYFRIDASGNTDKAVLITLIGYEDYSVKVSVLEAELKSNGNKLYLKKKANELSEVVVRPAKLTVAELGNDVACAGKEKDGLPFPFIYEKKKKGVVVKVDTLTEIGTLMKVKKRKTFIDSIQVNVGSCTHAEILYRLNIYEELNDEFKNILTEPIYIRLKKEQVGHVIRVNLTDKNIVVNHNFIVSLEKVKDLGPGKFTVCGKMFGAAMYMRIASLHDRFIKLPIIGMGIKSYVTFSEEEK
ncbi:carboxypeptidase-like regulatory domain-containing protein [Taibaiella koreensis]|uniref:carboxypeptidase-like regulatory domain-containing protein n=1 Tax=Taibaiella koreensis TaxID=1268548 RepID=UPI000E59CFF9|nr:carboxypeptidase-like regulatory domain-containing protein [Taibaiella koreensis]